MVRRFLWFALAALLFATHSLWLPLAARPLIRDDAPAKADLAVVLAGDAYGRRVLRAGELVRGGFVPAALVSGPPLYGVPESDLAIAFAVRNGYPAESFVSFPNSALSTRHEAAVILPELRRRNVRSFLLVTSDFHTARAGRIFRSGGRDLEMHVVAVPDEHFRTSSWWRTAEGMRIVFTEWSKTLATAAGI